MLITHILIWGLGSLVSAQVIGPELSENDELRYQCSRELAQIADGPLFFNSGILFTSVTSSNGHNLLIMQSAAGVFAAELKDFALNRVQVQIPLTLGSDKLTKVFLSYFHDARAARRSFEFALEAPPVGKESADYLVTRVSPAPYLKAHLDYLLLEHVDRLAFEKKGKVRPAEVRECTRLADKTPSFLRMSLYRLAGSPAAAIVGTADTAVTSLTVQVQAEESPSRSPASELAFK